MNAASYLFLGTTAVVALSSPASAARDLGSVITAACLNNASGEKLRVRLAEAILNEAGVLSSDVLSDQTFPQGMNLQDRAIRAVSQARVATVPAASNDIRALRRELENYLSTSSNVPMSQRKIVVATPPSGEGWLFDPGRTYNISCKGVKPAKDIITEFEEPKKWPPLVLREKVEELALIGDPAKKAGAVRVGLKRVRTEKDDGSTKTTKSLSITGTLGVRLTPELVDAPVYAYGSYALSRERTKPGDPNKDQSDGDVDALEIGVSVSPDFLTLESEISWVGSLRGAYVSDFAKDARRLKLAGSLVPGFPGSLGPLCDVGGYRPVDVGKFRYWTRCLLQLEAEASHVLEAGTADFKDRGKFLALGGKATYQIAASVGEKTDVIGSLSYRHMPTLFGAAPDLKRWDASVKYRFWTDAGLGLDFGLTWAKGHEPISYTQEDKIELGFGLIR